MGNKNKSKGQSKLSFISFKKITVLGVLFLICSASIGQMKMKKGERAFEKEIPVYDKSAHIVALTATYHDSKAHLSWTVYNQVKEGTYLIERSEDGIHYTIEGIKKGVPTKRKKEQVFNFTLSEQLNNQIYYRIKHVANNNSVIITRKVALTSEWSDSIY